MCCQSQNFFLGDWPTLVQIHFFKKIIWLFSRNQNSDVSKLNAKVNFIEPSVELKLIELPHVVKTGPEPTWLPSSHDVLSSTWSVSVEIKSPFRWGFQRGHAEAVRDVWEMDEIPKKCKILCSQVMTRMNL